MTTFSNDTSCTGKENLDYLDKFTTNENEIIDCRECGGTGFRDDKKPEDGICPCCAGTGMGNPNWDTDPDPFNNGGIPWDNGYSIFDKKEESGISVDEFHDDSIPF